MTNLVANHRGIDKRTLVDCIQIHLRVEAESSIDLFMPAPEPLVSEAVSR